MRILYTIAFSLQLITLPCFSQELQNTLWQNIELSLRTKKSVEATTNRLLQLKQGAIKNKDAASLARAYCYLMLLQDQKTEDSLYFHNSSYIDSILFSGPDAALKGIMHYLQAQRLWKFKKMGLKFNRSTYETRNLPVNYGALQPRELDSLINLHFELAAGIASHLRKTNLEPPIEKILWLSSTPSSFLNKPSLTDIIYNEQISYNHSEEIFVFDKKRVGAWLSLANNAFIDTLQAVSRQNSVKVRVLSLYNKWIEETADRKNVQASIEFTTRRYLYLELNDENDIALQKIWEAYLKAVSHSEYPEVGAVAIFNLCFLYKTWSDKYPSQFSYYDGRTLNSYDTSFQYYNVKALHLYESNKPLFERFGNLKEQLDELYELRDPFVQINMNYENIPAKPILLRLEYKNTPQLFYRIVRIGLKETIDQKKADTEQLAGRAIYRQQVVTLPLPEDYNLHRTFLKIDPLPPGRYYLLFSYDSSFEARRVSCQSFLVTSLAVINTANRVYVLYRSTGMPVAGAKVNASYVMEKGSGKTKFKDTLHHFYTTDVKGALLLPREEDYTLLISYKEDSLLEGADVEKAGISDDVFTKEDYDDLVDYYDENTRVEIFTDRSIYRPGQTVYFKALFLTKDPKTGEDCLLNEENLKKGFYNWLKKWEKEMEPGLLLQDPYGRTVDTLLIHPDGYGTVSGTFKLPRNAATGSWDIEPGYLEIGNNRGSFRVEEYKRPTFELAVSPPDKTYQFGDTLRFALKLKSFSGSTLNNIPVKYTIERTRTSKISYNGSYSQTIDIRDTTGYTNGQGMLIIQFVDTSMTGIDKQEDILFTYRLHATATEPTGESHEAKGSLKVATRPVMIRIPIYTATNKNDLRPLLINATDVNELEINRTLQARLYRISNTYKKYDKDYSAYADQWLYDRSELETWFEEVQFGPSEQEREDLIFETTINTVKKDKFRWPMELIATGRYRLEVTSMEEGILTGTASKTISIFEPGSSQLPTVDHHFFNLSANYLKKGDTLRLFSGSDRDSSYRIIQLKYYSVKGKKKTLENLFMESVALKGIQQWTWKLPEDITDRLLISEIFVAGGKVYHQEEDVDIAANVLQPNIIVEQFRSTLTPGAQTTYSVSIKTNDKTTAAQLMTVIYDASLDRLREHRWQIPFRERSRSLSSNWTKKISYEVGKRSILLVQTPKKSFKQPVWWLQSTGLTGGATTISVENPLLQLQGRVPGLMITNATGLDETIVMAYSETTRRFATGNVSTVKVKGINSIRLEDYNQPLVILDGVPFTGVLSTLNIKEIYEIMVLKDVDATAIYGSRGVGGVLLISTKGEIKLPVVKKEPVLKVRSNFNETTFFAPAIYADKKGFYKFTFTIPQSLTEWNWKLLAHTREMQFAYAEKKLVTQLPLMIQPQLPTLLYQSDRIIIKSRIANLDTVMMAGKAYCTIEDAVTGNDLTALLVAKPEVSFEAGAQANTIATFELKIPDTLLHPIKIGLTAKTGEYADGEEHEIPIISKQLLVKQNQEIVLNEKETAISQPAINNLYGVELSIQEKPQAALLNSLPFLANYSYNCAEQVFNRMYAHLTALKLMRKDITLGKLYHKAIPSTDKTTERPITALAQETMPWLTADNKAAIEQQELLEVLDTLRAKEKIKDYLEKIKIYQNRDGGMSWFPGGNSNAQISFYILARFGSLNGEGLYEGYNNLEDCIKNLIHYCDRELIGKGEPAYVPPVYYYYARSFWKKRFPFNDAQAFKMHSCFREYWKEKVNPSLNEQALLCLATMRYFPSQDSMYQNAVMAVQSIKERAIVDTVNGARWKELADAEEVGSTTEETISYLLEAFRDAGEGVEIESGIIQWLFTNKSQHPWRTTTGTAAIISVLMKQESSAAGSVNSVKALLPNATLMVSDGLLEGSRVSFHATRRLSPFVIQRVTETPVKVNLGWYYFSAPDSVSVVNKDVRIRKIITRLNEKTMNWEAVSETGELKLGEKIRITLTIETPKALRYVFISDQKAAALEPTLYQSGYNRGDGFSYYESIRDVGRQIFADFIPSGRTQINYEMKVAHEGSFSSGITTLECMYAPDITAYSNIQKIRVGN